MAQDRTSPFAGAALAAAAASLSLGFPAVPEPMLPVRHRPVREKPSNLPSNKRSTVKGARKANVRRMQKERRS